VALASPHRRKGIQRGRGGRLFLLHPVEKKKGEAITCSKETGGGKAQVKEHPLFIPSSSLRPPPDREGTVSFSQDA